MKVCLTDHTILKTSELAKSKHFTMGLPASIELQKKELAKLIDELLEKPENEIALTDWDGTYEGWRECMEVLRQALLEGK